MIQRGQQTSLPEHIPWPIHHELLVASDLALRYYVNLGFDLRGAHRRFVQWGFHLAPKSPYVPPVLYSSAKFLNDLGSASRRRRLRFRVICKQLHTSGKMILSSRSVTGST